MRSAAYDRRLRLGEPSRTISATVRYDGAGLARGTGGVMVAKTGPGQFTVTLSRPMMITSVQAMPEDTVATFASAVISGDSVLVKLWDSAGAIRDGVNFFLTVEGREYAAL